ncbi:hypothetical protein CR513_00575, partial [Mucuna pruriens]
MEGGKGSFNFRVGCSSLRRKSYADSIFSNSFHRDDDEDKMGFNSEASHGFPFEESLGIELIGDNLFHCQLFLFCKCCLENTLMHGFIELELMFLQLKFDLSTFRLKQLCILKHPLSSYLAFVEGLLKSMLRSGRENMNTLQDVSGIIKPSS